VTAHRRPPIPFSEAPRGTCRWCGATILYEDGPKRGQLDRRRRWHPACVDRYLESDPREARRRVRRRDRGICAQCRVDTYAIRRRFQGRGATKKLRELGFKPRKSLWELDHVVPLIEGGGHELSNLQTLCTPCHKRKTAQEAAARREARRESEEEGVLALAERALTRSQGLLQALAGPRAAEAETPATPARGRRSRKRPEVTRKRGSATSRRT
jgi:5-methylcytosine-specific restriction endonuclease McrA